MSLASNRYFEELDDGVVASRTRTGGALIAVTQVTRFILQLGGTMVLARLLSPRDYGLVAMVGVLTNFVCCLGDFGFGRAIIQKKKINEADVSTLFWLNVCLCVVAFIVLTACSPLVAAIFGHHELVLITISMAATISIMVSGLQHRALMQRRMEYYKIAFIDIFVIATSVGVGVLAARAGWGYKAILIQQLTMSVIQTGTSFILCPWIPLRRFRPKEVVAEVRFGGNIVLANMMVFLSHNTDNALIGWFCGPGPAGLYSKAYLLQLLPISQISGPATNVALPALSKLQDNPAEHRRYYLRMTEIVSTITIPACVFAFVKARAIFDVVMGPQWDAAVIIFQILALAMWVSATNFATEWVFVSLGKTREQFNLTLVTSLFQVAAIFVGLPWGVNGVALSVSLSQVITRIPGLYYAYKGTPISLRDFLSTQALPALASAIAALAALAVDCFFHMASIAELLLAAAVFGLVYFIATLLFRRGRKNIADLATLVPAGRRIPYVEKWRLVDVTSPSKRPVR
jgi:O-antigen/teichoic acid export membrane protein